MSTIVSGLGPGRHAWIARDWAQICNSNWGLLPVPQSFLLYHQKL